MKIYIKRFKDEKGNPMVEMPEIIAKGEWIDLRCAKDMKFKAPQSGVLKVKKNSEGQEERYRNVTFDIKLIPLGVAMQLPEGYEAIVVGRSSLPDGMGIQQANIPGVIDSTYCGNNDQWFFKAKALRNATIKANERICQFRIQLSQKATIWQKIKWLFSNKIELVEVDYLNNDDRGGNGSTGKE